MNVDPKTLQQLLQLQLYRPFFNAASSEQTDAFSFEYLLQMAMASSTTSPGAAAIAEESAAVYSLPLWTNAASAAFGLSPGLADSMDKAAAYGWNGSAAVSAYRQAAEAANFISSRQMNRASEPYDALILEASKEFGVDPALIKAVIATESGFNRYAVSPAGAKGLMQLTEATGRSLGVTDFFDPQQNIRAGTQYLAYLLERYGGQEATALAAYNAGPGRLARLGIAGDAELYAHYARLPQETQAYVHKVLASKRHYYV